MTDEQIDFLNTVVKSKNPESEVTKVDVTEIYEREFLNCANEKAYCTPYTLLRLLAFSSNFVSFIFFIFNNNIPAFI